MIGIKWIEMLRGSTRRDIIRWRFVLEETNVQKSTVISVIAIFVMYIRMCITNLVILNFSGFQSLL